MAEQKQGRGFRLVGDPGDPGSQAPTESMTFGAFVLSLSTSVAVLVGLAPCSEGGETPAPNLELARQTIDILEMLHAKTQGNLEPEEMRLLESVLHDLRLRYVEIHEKQG